MTRTVLLLSLSTLFCTEAAARRSSEPPPEPQPAIPAVIGRDPVDVESTAAIREHTTDPAYMTSWVDYLPASDTVPSPRQFLGYSIGTPDILTPPEQIHAYFRALAAASDRVEVFSMGRTHGGREMLVVAVADAPVLAHLDDLKESNRALSDPRVTDEARARELARTTVPIYWLTAGLHSPETGPPEMAMELAYRLAVSEQDHIREIRRGVVTLISPILEVDGRARMVDWYERVLKGYDDWYDMPPRMAPYWGDYTAHDNNRDGLQQSQPLTRNYTDTYFEYLPVVSLDLHESVPLLYVSMGTGPYNETVDPITVSEWHWLAGYDIAQATKLGLQGVWTWGFYTGWYPGYLLWVTNNHNATGRFYETFGNGHPGTFTRELKNAKYADKRLNARDWYRAWPPPKSVEWSLRNNTNYMQTGVLSSLLLAARNGDTLLFNYWRKGKNSLDRGVSEKPHAFRVPARQRDRGALHQLLWLLDRHRIEVHRLSDGAEVGGVELAKGDYLVRMDQPYRNFAKTLLSRQTFPKSAPLQPYDDVAWSLDFMLGVEVEAIDDPAVFRLAMDQVSQVPALPGIVGTKGDRWIVDHDGQAQIASLAWALPEADVRALAEPWDGHPRGSLVLAGVAIDELRAACGRLHLDAERLRKSPKVELIEVDLPRVALLHTWNYTQDSGWARYTLEELGVPYTLIDKDDLKSGGLGARFDVILFPSQGGRSFEGIIGGIDPKWGPIPYTKTAAHPSHGVVDASPDITGGIGFAGLLELQRFIHEGGLLVALGSGGQLASDSSIARAVGSGRPGGTPGSHITTKVMRPEHPVAWGFPELTWVFRGNLPVYDVAERDRGMAVMQFGTKTAAAAEREADKKADIPVEPDARKPNDDANDEPKPPPLVRSGYVKDPSSLERKPALLDVPVGSGRVLLYSWNPFHRYQNHHDFPFVTNALLFWNDMPKDHPTELEMRQREER